MRRSAGSGADSEVRGEPAALQKGMPFCYGFQP